MQKQDYFSEQFRPDFQLNEALEKLSKEISDKIKRIFSLYGILISISSQKPIMETQDMDLRNRLILVLSDIQSLKTKIVNQEVISNDSLQGILKRASRVMVEWLRVDASSLIN